MDPKGRDLLIFKSSAVGGWEPGGGDLGEFTCGKRWGFRRVFALATTVHLKFASLHGPLLSLKGSVAGFKGLRPPAAGPPRLGG